MATYCAVHVKTDTTESVLETLDQWWQETQGSVPERKVLNEWPAGLYGDSFFLDEVLPSCLVMAHTPPCWITIHYNSFDPLTPLAVHLSARNGVLVVTVMAQSVSEAYFLQVIENGQVMRTLYFAGDQGEWIRQEGDPLPFESQPLGRNISDDAEPFFVFGRDDAVAYCKNLGLELWGDHEPDTWWLLMGSPKRSSAESSNAWPAPSDAKKRPWWKIW